MPFDLSVIIPTYKRTDSLERLLDRLAVQQNVSLEIIVVDQNVAGYFQNGLLSKLKQVKHIRQDSPNASLARNNGFRNATAPHVLFLDDDLVPEKDFCAGGLEVFTKFPSIKSFVPLVYAHLGKELAFTSAKNKFIQSYPGNEAVFSITETISAAVFFERDYFELSGGFDIYLFDFAKTSEDQEFFLRMLQKNMTLWFVPDLEIFHDEKVEGGCELRTADYWNTRKKCSRALALRHRIHKANPGKLSLSDMVKLARFAFLNKQVLTSGFGNIMSEIRLLSESIKESKRYFLPYEKLYKSGPVNYIHTDLIT